MKNIVIARAILGVLLMITGIGCMVLSYPGIGLIPVHYVMSGWAFPIGMLVFPTFQLDFLTLVLRKIRFVGKAPQIRYSNGFADCNHYVSSCNGDLRIFWGDDPQILGKPYLGHANYREIGKEYDLTIKQALSLFED